MLMICSVVRHTSPIKSDSQRQIVGLPRDMYASTHTHTYLYARICLHLFVCVCIPPGHSAVQGVYIDGKCIACGCCCGWWVEVDDDAVPPRTAQ